MGDATAVDPPIRVLLVDDHEMFLESLGRLLGEEDDIEVVAIARSGAEAVASTLATIPDVVVMDYQLPNGSGAAATASIVRALPSTRVVMLSGHGDIEVLRESATAGCVAFVTKDKAVHHLVDAVRSAHQGVMSLPDAVGRLVPSWSEELPAPLSRREREVLGLLAEGMGTEEIGRVLFISRNTVRAHVQRVITKLGAHSKLEAVAIARRSGLV